MAGVDNVIAWMAIGVAASLAGMIWPFRRGVIGVIVNVVVGAAGAALVGLLSYAVLPGRQHDSPARLSFAALGAIASLGLMHAVWLRRALRRRRAAG
jgi:uncharacterized membrane protein YeaQ/YmgE (transglycosylase-associated protein family)